jgi:hypothetical protein
MSKIHYHIKLNQLRLAKGYTIFAYEINEDILSNIKKKIVALLLSDLM